METQNKLTLAVSGTGSAGMETCVVNLIERGDRMLVCKNGVFGGQCAEYCGAGHPAMSAEVRVVDPEDYQAWVERQKRLVEEGQRLAQVQRRGIEAEASATP